MNEPKTEKEKEILKALVLFDKKDWENSIIAWEKIIKERKLLAPFMYSILGDSYFWNKNFEKAKFNYQVYFGLESRKFKKEEVMFITDHEHEICLTGRKISRCIYELEGIKEAEKYLKMLFPVFKHPIIWEQLAVFMKESGHNKLSEYYFNEGKKIRKEAGLKPNLWT